MTPVLVIDGLWLRSVYLFFELEQKNRAETQTASLTITLNIISHKENASRWIYQSCPNKFPLRKFAFLLFLHLKKFFLKLKRRPRENKSRWQRGNGGEKEHMKHEREKDCVWKGNKEVKGTPGNYRREMRIH